MLQFKRIPKNGNVFITTFPLSFSLHSVPENTHFILDSILTLFGGGGNKTRESKEKKKVQKEKKVNRELTLKTDFLEGIGQKEEGNIQRRVTVTKRPSISL